MGGQRWTEEEDAWLKEHYPELGAQGCYRVGYLNRTHQAIMCRAPLLGAQWKQSSRFQSIDAWAKDWECCQECGTTERPHRARGLCKRCYDREWLKGENYCVDCGAKINLASTRCHPCAVKIREDKLRGGRWARDWDRCRGCGTTERPHFAKGLCRPCYTRAWDRGDYCCVDCGEEITRWGIRCNSCATKMQWARGDMDGIFISPTSIELQVAAALDIMGIEHTPQYRPDGISWTFDEFVPPATLIEINGDYWHGNDFPENQKRDVEKAYWAEVNGFEFLVFWECEIRERGAWALVMQRVTGIVEA